MKGHLPWKRETFDPTSWVTHLASLLPSGEVRGYGVRQTQVRILSAPLPGCANFSLSIFICSVQFSSVQSLSCVRLWPHGLQHARPPCPSPTPRVYPTSCPLSRWCHSTISSSVIPFSRLQSFPASGSFTMSQFFASGGQSIGASASVLPMNIQDLFTLGLTGLISLQSKGLSRVFSNTVQKHQFFGTQLSAWSNSHIHTWLLEKPWLWLYRPLVAKWCLCFLICCLDWL